MRNIYNQLLEDNINWFIKSNIGFEKEIKKYESMPSSVNIYDISVNRAYKNTCRVLSGISKKSSQQLVLKKF